MIELLLYSILLDNDTVTKRFRLIFLVLMAFQMLPARMTINYQSVKRFEYLYRFDMGLSIDLNYECLFEINGNARI